MGPRCPECGKEVEDPGYCWDCQLDGYKDSI